LHGGGATGRATAGPIIIEELQNTAPGRRTGNRNPPTGMDSRPGRTGRYQSLPGVSPPARVYRAANVRGVTSWWIHRTLPSPMMKFDPWPWKL
jgi:hypothetical protein